jgi:hypothetical protein
MRRQALIVAARMSLRQSASAVAAQPNASVCGRTYLGRPSSMRSIKRAQLLEIRQLIFGNYSLDILRFAFNAVSKSSICLDGQPLNNGVHHWGIDRGTTLWTLWLMANVLNQLVSM